MTPVVKAYLTDRGFEATNLGLQTFGGHGYIREFGMEQYVRDARIGQIYEGTNGVQAMDLVGRKLAEGNGRLLERLLEPTMALIAEAREDATLTDLAERLATAVAQLVRATATIGTRAAHDPNELGAAATDYLHLMGLVSLGAMWLRMALVARARLAAGNGQADARFYETKLATARFYFARMLPETAWRLAAVEAGAGEIMSIELA
jgi:hypothetical protein